MQIRHYAVRTERTNMDGFRVVRSKGSVVICIRAAAILGIICLTSANVSRGQEHIDIDGNFFHFGDTVTVSGICPESDSRDNDYGFATISTKRIDGQATQQKIDFLLMPNSDQQPVTEKDLLNLKPKAHYLVRGKLTNARINGLNNACGLQVDHIEEIPATELKVADFVDREATFEGLAGPDGKFHYGGESVSVEGVSVWPNELNGKHISISGIVRKAVSGLRIERPTWKLYRLEDLVNEQVVLDGVIASLNDNWWFSYRGERLYLTSPDGPVLRFESDDHYRAARVTGQLVRQLRPSLDQITRKVARDLVPTYVIRHAHVELLGRSLTLEQRFGTFYPSRHSSKDGVPELLAETSFRRNLGGDETRAMLFAERNSKVIRQILQEISAEHRDVLARRMSSEETDGILRLLYASMLANANDDRGREYLLKAVQIRDNELDLDALYCIGVFPFLAIDTNRKIDLDWAEQPFIEIIGNWNEVTVRGAVIGSGDDDSKMKVASAAVLYSSIPTVLRQIGSDDCRRALLDYVVAKADWSELVAIQLLQWELPLASAELLQIDKLVDDDHVHRTILQVLLARKSPDVVDRYSDELGDGFVYMDFRDQLSPEIVDQLKARLDQLEGEARTNAQMLIALGENDAVPALMKMLDDPGWIDKNIVLYELARLGDARAVAPVARFLREAPKAAVKDDNGLSAVNTVEHALDAVAHAGTSDAIRELIELLPTDLARFGGDLSREEWQLIVAAHLIELTGESFATDVEEWRAWQRAHPMHSVRLDLANPDAAFRTNPGNALDLSQ